jgi:hypothetical protein
MARPRTVAKWAAVTVVGLCTAAVVTIPLLVRNHEDRYPSFAIGDTRDFISAEASYQAANKGFYDTLECLCHPSRCIPAYEGPAFLDGRFESATRQGYLHEFHAGIVSDPAEVAKDGASPSSLETFAYVSLPTPRTSKRPGVCGDSTGVICTTRTGGRPRLEHGQCVVESGPMPKAPLWPSSLPEEEPCYPLR